MKYLIGIALLGLLASCLDIPLNKKATSELNDFSAANFEIHKKFVEDFQKGWNSMDVNLLGGLNTADTVFINYTSNEILKVSFKDANFWNSFFSQYKSLSWNFSSISPVSDKLEGLVVKSYSVNEMKNGETSNEKWVMFFYFNSENQLVEVDEYMK